MFDRQALTATPDSPPPVVPAGPAPPSIPANSCPYLLADTPAGNQIELSLLDQILGLWPVHGVLNGQDRGPGRQCVHGDEARSSAAPR